MDRQDILYTLDNSSDYTQFETTLYQLCCECRFKIALANITAEERRKFYTKKNLIKKRLYDEWSESVPDELRRKALELVYIFDAGDQVIELIYSNFPEIKLNERINKIK